MGPWDVPKDVPPAGMPHAGVCWGVSSTGVAGVAGTGAGPVRANEISPRASRGFFASVSQNS